MKFFILTLFFFGHVPFNSQAQFCSGSLGDPVVNVTFGKNRGQLPDAVTTFAIARGCPSPGQYTLANLIFGCGEDRSWLMLAGDRAPEEAGNYMLVNAQSSNGITAPAVVYRDTVKGLCSNVNYVYSAWVTGALQRISCGGNAVASNLTLLVTTLSGNVLGKVETGNLPILDEKRWKEYGFAFNVPPGESSVVFSITTEKKAGCGQGFAVDDITIRPCGPATTATINGSAGPMNICADFTNSLVLKGAYAAGLTSPQVQWQSSKDTGKTWQDIPTATTLTYTIPQAAIGTILYRMLVAEGANIRLRECRFASNVIYTTIHPVPPHQAPQNLLGCLDKDLQLPAKDPFAHYHWWTGPNGFAATNNKPIIPQIRLRDTGLYLLKQDFNNGCITLDSFYVKVYPSTTISVQPEYSICEGQGVTIPASGEGNFVWQPTVGLSSAQVAAPYASPRDSTQYKVVLTNSFGCKDSALVTVNVFRNPKVSAGSDKTIVKGDTVTLNGVVTGTAIQFLWSPSLFISNNAVLTPNVFPPADMQYKLTATSTVGCGVAEAVTTVKVYNDIFVANAFSPNNDGKNDLFKIVAADGYQLLKFQVYNRWGQVVYTAKDFSKGWDGTFNGTPQPQDTYVYYLHIKSAQGRVITKRGTVTLMR